MNGSVEGLPEQPRVTAAWYVACHSRELRDKPVRVEIWEQPLVLWRGRDATVGCLLDRCPHRGVPLSQGRVIGGELQCAYHGWRFGSAGEVTRVPGLIGEDKIPRRCATRFPVVERQGLVWVWLDDREPDVEPFHFPHADDPAYTTVRKALRTPGSIHQVIENALDVPHTAFLHGGLFRNDSEQSRNRIEVRIRRWQDRCEAQYIGEPRPGGLAGRLLSPSGGEVEHFDRFYLPSITEVEYRLGPETHLVLSSACTPHHDWETTMHAVVSVRSPFPGWLVKLIVQPVALRIFRQDAEMLARQVDNHARFGEERYVSTEIDLLGPHILALLRRASRSGYQPDDGDPAQIREAALMV